MRLVLVLLHLAAICAAGAVPHLDSTLAKDTRTQIHAEATTYIGHDHGGAFDDKAIVTTAGHLRLASIELSGCGPGEHLSQIKLAFRNNLNGGRGPVTLGSKVNHGQGHGSSVSNTMSLLAGERVKEVHLTTWRKKMNTSPFTRTFHTRIGWIKFVTDKGNTVECGSKWDKDHVEVWNPKDKSLLYFSGSQGDVIDALQGWFIPNADY